MTINRRITGGKRIAHHKLFGALEMPPLGWCGDEKGFSYSLKDYEAEVAAKIKSGIKPVQAHREVGRHHGPQAWNWLDTFYLSPVWVPKHLSSRIPAPMSADREFRFNPEHNAFIAGWWYDRYASKLGPTNTIAAWVATHIGYISQGQPHVHRSYDHVSVTDLEHGDVPKTYRDTNYFMEPSRCVGINPYTDFQYIGEFTRPIREYPEYVKPIIDEVLKRFFRLHKLGAIA